MPWLQLGETIFTLDYEVKRMNPRIFRLGGCLLPEFGKIRNKRKELARNYRNILAPMRPDIVFLHDADDEGIALLRFPIMFKSREKRDPSWRAQEKRAGRHRILSGTPE